MVLRFAIGRAIIQILACIPSPVSAATCAGAAAALTLATGGSVLDAIKSAAFAFVQMEVFSHVGAYLRDVGLAGDFLAKGLVHGVVGGAMSMAQGGAQTTRSKELSAPYSRWIRAAEAAVRPRSAPV